MKYSGSLNILLIIYYVESIKNDYKFYPNLPVVIKIHLINIFTYNK